MVDRLGQTELVDTGLETALQEILDLQGQDVIELHAGLIEHTDADQTANQGITLEQTLGVLLVESEQLTAKGKKVSGLLRTLVVCGRPKPPNLQRYCPHVPSSTTNLGQGELDTPDLTLVAQTVFSDNLQFRVTSKSG